MRRLYTLLIYLAAPVAFAILLARGLRDRGYWQGLLERFGYGPALPGNRPGIWVHAVSLGEVSAAAPLVHELKRRHRAAHLVLTCATPTGRARAMALFGDGVVVRYLPYDLPGAMRRFMQDIRPQTLIIMETELWPNLFRECARQSVPIVLASARLSEKSVARYRRCGSLFRDLFAPDVVVGAQSANDAARFEAIGADPLRTRIVGNLKFDIDIDADAEVDGRSLRSTLFGARPVWIAGSTHEGEEEQVLAAHDKLRKRQPDALLVLVPRHPQRFDAVAALLIRRKYSYVRRSADVPAGPGHSVFLLDTTGELQKFYAAADVAFVGGSLVPIGGHNLLEPASLGMPVLTGPSDANGREIAALLTDLGAVRRVANAHELAVELNQLLADPALRSRLGALGRDAVAANRGSVARVLDLVTCISSNSI